MRDDMWVVAGHFLHIESFFSTGHPLRTCSVFFEGGSVMYKKGHPFATNASRFFMNISVASRWFDGLENVWIRSFSNLSS